MVSTTISKIVRLSSILRLFATNYFLSSEIFVSNCLMNLTCSSSFNISFNISYRIIKLCIAVSDVILYCLAELIAFCNEVFINYKISF